MSRKVLIVLTEWVTGVRSSSARWRSSTKAGYLVDFSRLRHARWQEVARPAREHGPSFVDIAQQKTVTSLEMAEKVRAIQDSNRLDHPIDLSQWLPDRPYASSSNDARELETYNATLQEVTEQIGRKYDTVLIVGRSGALVDLVNNFRVNDLILAFYGLGKPVAAECYGVSCLAFARDPVERVSIIRGKHVTGHVLEYEHKDGTIVVGVDGTSFNMGPPPSPLEHVCLKPACYVSPT